MRTANLAKNFTNTSPKWLWLIAGVLIVGLVAATSGFWWPPLRTWAAAVTSPSESDEAEDAPAHDHAGHDHAGHDHAGHEDATSLELSEQARRNIGLKTGVVELETFERSITMPAMVAERPGRTEFRVAAPVTGVVTGVYALEGQSVESGTLLFRLRLTHEDLVEIQTEFLKTLGQLDVERKEIARLDEATRSGSLAKKVLLEHIYKRDVLEAALNAQRESLRLHGLTTEQVERIERERTLVRELTVSVPMMHVDSSLHDDDEEPHA
ncbi:MAG: efflux RND transporter periplasmic adaptor subunit, partial [Planctomycetaceae bacterium]